MSSKRKCVHKTNKMLFHYNKSHQCRAIDAPLMIKSSQKDARTKITNHARQKKKKKPETNKPTKSSSSLHPPSHREKDTFLPFSAEAAWLNMDMKTAQVQNSEVQREKRTRNKIHQRGNRGKGGDEIRSALVQP